MSYGPDLHDPRYATFNRRYSRDGTMSTKDAIRLLATGQAVAGQCPECGCVEFLFHGTDLRQALVYLIEDSIDDFDDWLCNPRAVSQYCEYCAPEGDE